MRQQEYAMICFRTLFCFVFILVPQDRREMFLYSKFTYGFQFSGEKKRFENPMIVCRDICKINTAPFFLKYPVYHQNINHFLIFRQCVKNILKGLFRF